MALAESFLTANFAELHHFPREINSYESLYKFSLEKNDLFWTKLGKTRLDWFQLFDKVREGDFTKDVDWFDLKWFVNGKLNVSGYILFQS